MIIKNYCLNKRIPRILLTTTKHPSLCFNLNKNTTTKNPSLCFNLYKNTTTKNPSLCFNLYKNTTQTPSALSIGVMNIYISYSLI